MTEKPRYRDEKLPVTAEVGSEGGSYADPTYQEPTRKGDIETDSQPIGPDHIIPGGPDPDGGMKKRPTD
jgi:hypothetical protein